MYSGFKAYANHSQQFLGERESDFRSSNCPIFKRCEYTQQHPKLLKAPKLNNSPYAWAGDGILPNPTLDSHTTGQAIREWFVDTAQSSLEIIKEQVRKTVYNDKNLELPEISLLDLSRPSESEAPTNRQLVYHGNGDVTYLNNPSGGNGNFFRTDSSSGLKPGLERTINAQNDSTALKTEKGFDKKFEITSDGREREYTLHVPPGYDGKTPMPLVVVLHGLSQDSNSIAKLSAMSEKADKEGFIVAYPNATKWLGVKSLRAWDVDNGVQIPGTDSNDVGFIRDMVTAIKGNMAVDQGSVYAAGFSNGGMLTYKLASQMSETFSAVAVISGGSDGKEMKPSKDVSVLSIHGDRDKVVPKNGSWYGTSLVDLGLPSFQSTEQSFQQWKSMMNIQDQPVVRNQNGVVSAQAVNKETGTEVVSYMIHGGTHEWPGSARAIKTNPNSAEANFNATDKIWDFFKAHSRTPKTEPAKDKYESLLTA